MARPGRITTLPNDLCPAEAAPPTLFGAVAPASEALMGAMDRLNARFGRGTVFPAAAGVERGWGLRAANRSPRWTTNLAELPRVRA